VTNFTLMTQPTNGTLSGSAPNLTYTPATNYNGADNFTFTVDDGSLTSAVATVSITVTAINDAPVAFSQSVTIPVRTPKPIVLTASDVDNNPLTFTIDAVPVNGVISDFNTNTGTLTYTPSSNFSGPDSFTFRVDDGQTESESATVNITVTPLADISAIVTGPASVFTGVDYSYTVTVSNAGPSIATGLSVNNLLPEGVDFVSASAGGTHNAGVITWQTVSTLASGATSNFTVTVTPTANAGAVLTNFVSSTSDTADPDSSNNDGTSAAARAVSTVYNRPTITGQRLPGGAFQLQLTTAPNMTVSFEASTNLVDWQTLSVTNSGGGIISFMDYDATDYQKRFYRSVQ
jgi:uncharacterized repeat protein (TIGR01451 family)